MIPRLPSTSATSRSPALGRRRRRRRGRGQRPGRLVVGRRGGHRDQFPLGVAQCGEAAAEDAAGVDADRVVHPGGFGYRGVAVHHGRLAPVVLCPRVPDGQAELVGLPRGLAVQREGPDRGGRAPVHLLAQAGVGDHQPPRVQHVVAHQAVEERGDLGGEGCRLRAELGERLRQAVAHPDVAAAQRAQQLGLVVAGNAERGAGRHHAHRRAQHPRRVRAAVDQVAEEHRGAPGRVVAGPVLVGCIAEQVQQAGQFRLAAVHVADDVEGPVQAGLVGPGGLPDDPRRVHLRHAAQPEYPAEPLALQPPGRPGQRRVLPPDHPGAERTVRAALVALDAGLLGHVEHDRHRQDVVVAGQVNQWGGGRPAARSSRVDHGEPAEARGARRRPRAAR